MLFSEFSSRWLEDSIHLGAGTKAKYLGALRSRVLPVFGDRQIGEITRVQVKSWVAQLHGDGLAPATVGTLYRVLHAVMEAAVVDDESPRVLWRL